jgi:hypothetical protein
MFVLRGVTIRARRIAEEPPARHAIEADTNVRDSDRFDRIVEWRGVAEGSGGR